MNTQVSQTGFNGEFSDPVLHQYILGNGYRAYNPTLQRFTRPDNMSPFGQGGINPYLYCEGDPINRTDPTGHMFVVKAVTIAAREIDKTLVRSVMDDVAAVVNDTVSKVADAVDLGEGSRRGRANTAGDVEFVEIPGVSNERENTAWDPVPRNRAQTMPGVGSVVKVPSRKHTPSRLLTGKTNSRPLIVSEQRLNGSGETVLTLTQATTQKHASLGQLIDIGPNSDIRGSFIPSKSFQTLAINTQDYVLGDKVAVVSPNTLNNVITSISPGNRANMREESDQAEIRQWLVDWPI